eukprot:TRINITY_DN6746_c0_g1_i1.p1 TRINITY_DN6746_c0_g1~~TRINITY_DN6746_c0_g1_i1.p1  ORF type:complete len:731 (+),score=65.41 TRINITY_DN6746_c0_g1_i1:65-2257(+)
MDLPPSPFATPFATNNTPLLASNSESSDEFNSVDINVFSRPGRLSYCESAVDVGSQCSYKKNISFPRNVSDLLNAGLDSENRTDVHRQTPGGRTIEEVYSFQSSLKLERQSKRKHFASTRSIQRVDSDLWDKLCREFDNKQRGRSIFKRTPVFPPEHIFCTTWNAFVLVVDAIYSAFLVPIIVFFFLAEDPDFMLGWISLFAGTIFFADLLMGFHHGLHVETPNGKCGMMLDGKAVAEKYIQSSRFWVNLISTISLPLTAFAFFSNFGVQEFWIRTFFYCLQLVRMSRVAGVIKNIFREMYGYKNEFIGHSLSTNELFILGIIYTALFYFNLAGCIWYATARLVGFDNSWVSELPHYDMQDTEYPATVFTKPKLYVASIYFIMCTVTTVGYGDITPHSWQEQLVVMFIIGVGSILFAFYLALVMDLFASYGNLAREAKAFRDKMVEVNMWMKEFDLPLDMKREVHTFFGVQHLKQQRMYNNNILEGLPGYLRGKIAKHIARDVICELDLFKHITRRDIVDHICYRLKMINTLPGEVLCVEGDASNSLWIVQSGEVSITRWNHLVKVVRAPDTIAEIGFLQDVLNCCSEHYFSMECISDCTLWQLSLSDLRPMMNQLSESEQFVFVAMIVKNLEIALDHFHYEDEQLEQLKRDVDAYVSRLKRGNSVFNFPKDILYQQLKLDFGTKDVKEHVVDSSTSIIQNPSLAFDMDHQELPLKTPRLIQHKATQSMY